MAADFCLNVGTTVRSPLASVQALSLSLSLSRDCRLSLSLSGFVVFVIISSSGIIVIVLAALTIIVTILIAIVTVIGWYCYWYLATPLVLTPSGSCRRKTEQKRADQPLPAARSPSSRPPPCHRTNWAVYCSPRKSHQENIAVSANLRKSCTETYSSLMDAPPPARRAAPPPALPLVGQLARPAWRRTASSRCTAWGRRSGRRTALRSARVRAHDDGPGHSLET